MMFLRLMSAAVLSIAAATAHAQVVLVPSAPQIGSSNPVTAEPQVTRPHTHPCVVQLFQNLEFADFTPKTYNYTPPASCPGPWSKVVFTADFTVTAGRQFDLDGVVLPGRQAQTIFYGDDRRAALARQRSAPPGM